MKYKTIIEKAVINQRVKLPYVPLHMFQSEKRLCKAFLNESTIRCGGHLAEAEILEHASVVTTASIEMKKLDGTGDEKIISQGTEARNLLAIDAIKNDVIQMAIIYAKKYSCQTGFSYMDFVQIASIGAINAASNYNPDLNLSFKKYSYIRIKGALDDALRKDGGPIKLPRGSSKLVDDETISESLRSELGREPTPEEIYDKKMVVMQKIFCRYVPIDEPPGSSANEDPGNSPLVLPASNEETPDNILIEDERLDIVNKALAMLKPKERDVILKYYRGDKTLKEIGEELGIRESWVCQIKNKALDDMRKTIAVEYQ